MRKFDDGVDIKEAMSELFKYFVDWHIMVDNKTVIDYANAKEANKD